METLIEILASLTFIIVVGICSLILSQFKKNKAYGKGIQALLRNELYRIYTDCVKKGYATAIEKSNFENLYTQYHALGKNGVMTEYRKELLAMKESKSKR